MTAVGIPLRHELKFYINNMEYEVLARALDAVLQRDPNGDEYNEYHIRSLYFDTMMDDALYEKINGVPSRNKYRIRIYNFSDQMIRLECKSKYGNLISKRSLKIPRDLCEQMIAGDPTGLELARSGLLRDVYREMRLRLLKPVVIVDYVREAYLHPAEEVRITFDKQLRSGLFSTDLFDRWLPTMPVLKHDEVILEVKYDHVLPTYIRDLIQNCCRTAVSSAISKYVICRQYEGKEA